MFETPNNVSTPLGSSGLDFDVNIFERKVVLLIMRSEPCVYGFGSTRVRKKMFDDE